jgi:transcriptional regulator with GAF, ATPase, and Fis domain
MNPRLIGVRGPFYGTKCLLADGETAIGRDSSNHLWTADPALSRRHCVIISAPDGFSIRDLKSRNGTILNGAPVEEQRLRHGDQVFVGDSVLVFLTEDDEAHHLERSSVEFDTAEIGGTSLTLRQEDAMYLQPKAQSQDIVRALSDLESLLKISTSISGIRDEDSLAWQLLGLIFDVVPADCGAVLLSDDSGEFDSSVAWDRVRGPGHPVRVSRTVVDRVVREKVGLLACNVPTDAALSEIKTLSQLGVRALLCVPLVVKGAAAGVIYLDTKNPNETFDENHLQVMSAVAGIAALALDNVRHWQRLQAENQELRAEVQLEHNMVGGSAPMRELFESIRRVAPTDATVLIQGESGTGKELVARAIHSNSSRRDGPFIAINCAAITETLLESELFGHEKGSFTGAVAQKKGKMELAEKGTLFLDEVTELSPALQAKMLRVLQEREFERVGGTRSMKLDIRLIAATNRDLKQATESGTFRKDLYYRLNVVSIAMPPLRERREDIPQIAEYFITKAARKSNLRPRNLSPEARACLVSYDWPGNVRELENAIERALVLGTTDLILPDDLPDAVVETATAVAGSAGDYHSAVCGTKRTVILQALQRANGNYIDAARSLGMHPNSLLRLIRNLGLKEAVKSTTPH